MNPLLDVDEGVGMSRVELVPPEFLASGDLNECQ